MYACVFAHVPGAVGVQKSMSDFLEMELGVVVSH